MTNTVLEVVPVRVTEMPTSAPKDKTASTYTQGAVAAALIPGPLLPHAPNRVQTTLTVCGTAGDSALLCKSFGDAQQGVGALIQPGMVICPMEATSEMWLVAKQGASVQVGVIAVYAELT